jgi:hypothetical protein
MEQRPLRLGDIVDDYCPRERRLTNHAVVAIVDQTIRQTRCTTCDADHMYKGGRPPLRRKKDEITDLSGGQLVAARPVANGSEIEVDEASLPVTVSRAAAAPVVPIDPTPMVAASEPEAPSHREEERDTWPGHRQLIRATLPKTEGDVPPARPIPEFTMHQRPQGRGGHGYRQAQPWRGGNGQAHGGFGPERNGNVPPRHGGDGANGNGRPGRHRGRHKRSR